MAGFRVVLSIFVTSGYSTLGTYDVAIKKVFFSQIDLERFFQSYFFDRISHLV